MIKKALNSIENKANPDLETIIEYDSLTRNYLKA